MIQNTRMEVGAFMVAGEDQDVFAVVISQPSRARYDKDTSNVKQMNLGHIDGPTVYATPRAGVFKLADGSLLRKIRYN